MSVAGCAVLHVVAREARLWEIAENLHRAELTNLERDENIAEWIRITERLHSRQIVGNEGKRDDGRGHRQEGGIAASRELGLHEKNAERAVTASISDEAKEAARETGLDDNRSALLKVDDARPAAGRIQLRMARTPQDIIEIGRDLINVKSRGGHGNFLGVEAEFGMSERSAGQFIGVAECFGTKTATVADFTPSVLYELAAPSTPDAAVVDKAVGLIDAGEQVPGCRGERRVRCGGAHSTERERGPQDDGGFRPVRRQIGNSYRLHPSVLYELHPLHELQ